MSRVSNLLVKLLLEIKIEKYHKLIRFVEKKAYQLGIISGFSSVLSRIFFENLAKRINYGMSTVL